MISFRQFLTLNENRIEWLKNNSKPFDTGHDTLAKNHNINDIVDHFAKADPTPKKTHTQWILNQYRKGHIRQEDTGRIHDTLTNFEKYKPKLEKKDINQYKHISHVDDAVHPHLGADVTSNKQQKKNIKSEGADLIHDGPNLTVHHLKTKEAAMQYGAGTKWCTAAKKHNAFDEYNKEGPLYVVQNKHNGEKHQFHFGASQFMDAKDEPIDLHHFVKKNPELINVKQFRDSSHGMYFAKDKKEFNQKMNHALNSNSVNAAHTAAIHHPDITPEHITKALNVDDWTIRDAAISHPKATPEHITKALNDKDEFVREVAIRHPKATPEHITKALNDKSDLVRQTAISRSNITSEHITKALDDKEFAVKLTAINHPKVTPEHITKALNDKNEFVREAAIHHPNATTEHITKALNDKNSSIRAAAIRHSKATPEHITKALDDEHPGVRNTAISHPKATPEHITKALNDKSDLVRQTAISRSNITSEHITKALNDNAWLVRSVAQHHSVKN